MNEYRTLLEQKIKERRQTFEEFAEYAEVFARDHGEPGTLSVRHLQRLAAGRRSDGRPLGQPLPATVRLLEHIFGVSIDTLLATPTHDEVPSNQMAETRSKLHISSRVDIATVDLLREQLGAIRRLDRQLGAIVAYNEVLGKIDQVKSLFIHSLTVNIRERLAALLSELLCLAGWQALDLGHVTEAWHHYDNARTVALEVSAPSYFALAEAGRAFVLCDITEAAAAVTMLDEVEETIAPKCSPLVRSWLAAAYGETLAANTEEKRSLCAFDRAEDLLPTDSIEPDCPYVALDPVHLARWRGGTLAQFASPDAVDVLTTALNGLDSSFIRAETALRVDLASALATIGEFSEARHQAHRASELGKRIGSKRQQRRMHRLIVAAGDDESTVSD
ncbi:MAG TPA: hypothetical protein VGJ45_38750 [Pseudonocardiaceae bacterium]|jgi:hypothetical protein